jgi:hypothetical protein
MNIRAIVSGLALAAVVGFSASAASLSSSTGTTAAPAAGVDMNLLNSFMNGRPQLEAQAACQKATEQCDDQHPCCKGLTCVSNLFDKTKVCDFRG